MFKKIIWIFILLVMTACTIVFSDQISLGEGEPPQATLEPFEPTDIIDIINETIEIPTVAATDSVPPAITPEEVGPETTPTATEVVVEVRSAFVLQEGTPVYMPNFNYLDKGCNWQGVAGQVFGEDNVPVSYLIVKVFGTWNSGEVSKIAVTGMVEGKPYGEGSYEIELGNIAADSIDPLFIQVFNSDGDPLSDPYQLTTRAACDQNLTIVNFVTN